MPKIALFEGLENVEIPTFSRCVSVGMVNKCQKNTLKCAFLAYFRVKNVIFLL